MSILKVNIQKNILLTGDISVAGDEAGTAVAFKNCAPFIKCTSYIPGDQCFC